MFVNKMVCKGNDLLLTFITSINCQIDITYFEWFINNTIQIEYGRICCILLIPALFLSLIRPPISQTIRVISGCWNLLKRCSYRWIVDWDRTCSKYKNDLPLTSIFRAQDIFLNYMKMIMELRLMHMIFILITMVSVSFVFYFNMFNLKYILQEVSTYKSYFLYTNIVSIYYSR